jgi:hypothetical protein
MTRITRAGQRGAMKVKCPNCLAEPGYNCLNLSLGGTRADPHVERVLAAFPNDADEIETFRRYLEGRSAAKPDDRPDS